MKAKEVRFLGSVLGFGSDNPRENTHQHHAWRGSLVGAEACVSSLLYTILAYKIWRLAWIGVHHDLVM